MRRTVMCFVILSAGAALADGPNELFTGEKITESKAIEQRTSESAAQEALDRAQVKKEPLGEVYKHDNFVLPSAQSKIPYRFILTSLLKHGEPVDRLASISIGGDQPSLYLYMKLIGTEQSKPYGLRLRVLDAKRELVFDREASFTSSTNSIVFRSVISPKRVIDAGGIWEFQGILDGQRLFVEKREVIF